MGKPTNTRSSGCAVTTSNCVVWQGPDLCCINLCHGDTISDVINELAKRICKIFEMLDVQSYDLSELINTECPPANFVELIQLLIDTIAKVNTGKSSQDAPMNEFEQPQEAHQKEVLAPQDAPSNLVLFPQEQKVNEALVPHLVPKKVQPTPHSAESKGIEPQLDSSKRAY